MGIVVFFVVGLVGVGVFHGALQEIWPILAGVIGLLAGIVYKRLWLSR